MEIDDRIEKLGLKTVLHSMTTRLVAWDLKLALIYLKNTELSGLGNQISPIVKMVV